MWFDVASLLLLSQANLDLRRQGPPPWLASPRLPRDLVALSDTRAREGFGYGKSASSDFIAFVMVL